MVAGRFFPLGVPIDAPSFKAGGERAQHEVSTGLLSRDYGHGPLTNRQPIAISNNPQTGRKMRSFFDDYYNRVHVIPGAIDFGAVAVEVKRTFYLWNSWQKPVTLDVLLADGDEGLTLAGLVPGAVLRPLGSYAYDAIAREDGPAQFNAAYTFRFDTGEVLPFNLTGERARLAPFGPNWRDNYRVTVEYKTEVLTSRSGREQRRALRQKSRKSVSFTATSQRAALRAFNRHMATWQNRVVIMPEEPRFVRTTADVPEGNTVFEVESVADWMSPGATVFARSLFGEVITEIEAVVGTTVTTASPIPHDMPAGAMFLLALYGRFGESMSSTRETSTVAETDVEFAVNPSSENRPVLRPLGPTLDGRPIFETKPNWKDRPKLTYLTQRETLDYGQGRVAVFTPVDFAARQYDFMFSTRGGSDDVRDLVELFDRCRGRAGEFYYPSWERDIVLEYDLIAGTRGMEFDGSAMFDQFEGDTVHRAVAIRLHDGTTVYNSLFEEPKFTDGKSVFTFRHDWPQTIRADEPLMVCWLYVSRFASDKITVEWFTREVAQVKATFQTLEDLPYEL